MNAAEWSLQLRFLLALALGFLIGLERERSATTKPGRSTAGLRTFTLVSLSGFGCAWLQQAGIAFAVPVGLLAFSALAVSAYFAKLNEGRLGWTTEAMVLLTFVIGALSLKAEPWLPLSLGIIGTLLLSEKARFEHFVQALDSSEFLAVLKFLIVTALILPLLPDRPFTQFALNPSKLWMIVVLVSSVGFAGYFLIRRFGQTSGWWLSGVAGGIVSSTALSVAAGRIAQQNPAQAQHALQAVVLASSVMYLRLLALIALLSPAFATALWWRLALLCGAGLVIAWLVRPRNGEETGTNVAALQNPFEIVPALVFAALFVVFTVVTVFARANFGESGLLVLSALIGLSDITPVVLSLVNDAAVTPTLIAAILVAMMTNTMAKGVYFSSLVRSLRRATLMRFGIWAALHVPLIFLG
ncbi:MAG TPA: MgtC/SapB family protein [Opitutaceae bacterium]|nr:MgtC/SapB family protein [Opitutaceae bacterium]